MVFGPLYVAIPPSSPLGKIPHLKGARMDGAFCPHAQHIRQGAKKKREEN